MCEKGRWWPFSQAFFRAGVLVFNCCCGSSLTLGPLSGFFLSGTGVRCQPTRQVRPGFGHHGPLTHLGQRQHHRASLAPLPGSAEGRGKRSKRVLSCVFLEVTRVGSFPGLTRSLLLSRDTHIFTEWIMGTTIFVINDPFTCPGFVYPHLCTSPFLDSWVSEKEKARRF